MMICKVCNQQGNGYCAAHSTSGVAYLEIQSTNDLDKEFLEPKIEKWEEEFDKIMEPPKFIPELEGKDCLTCGHPMPNSRGAELLKSFISKLLQSQRLEIAEEVKKIGRGSDGYTLWALDKVLKLLTQTKCQPNKTI